MPASDTTAPAPNPASRHDDVVAIVNASGGSDEETIRARLVEAGIRVVDTDDSLEDQIATLVESGTKVIGVAGGDGSLRSAAVALADGDVALLPIAGGTKNHFAKAAGLPTVDHSIAALERRDVIRVPLAALNEHCFLNTAVIGWYPDLVATRERLRKVLPWPIAGGLAALRHVSAQRPVRRRARRETPPHLDDVGR